MWLRTSSTLLLECTPAKREGGFFRRIDNADGIEDEDIYSEYFMTMSK